MRRSGKHNRRGATNARPTTSRRRPPRISPPLRLKLTHWCLADSDGLEPSVPFSQSDLASVEIGTVTGDETVHVSKLSGFGHVTGCCWIGAVTTLAPVITHPTTVSSGTMIATNFQKVAISNIRIHVQNVAPAANRSGIITVAFIPFTDASDVSTYTSDKSHLYNCFMGQTQFIDRLRHKRRVPPSRQAILNVKLPTSCAYLRQGLPISSNSFIGLLVIQWENPMRTGHAITANEVALEVDLSFTSQLKEYRPQHANVESTFQRVVRDLTTNSTLDLPSFQVNYTGRRILRGFTSIYACGPVAKKDANGRITEKLNIWDSLNYRYEIKAGWEVISNQLTKSFGMLNVGS